VRRLAEALERARASRSRNGKEEAIAAALAAIGHDGDDEALATAARLASGRVLAIGDGRVLGVGGSLLFDVVREATGLDDVVTIACARRTGDLAEAFGLLLRRVPGAPARPGVSFAEVARLAGELAAEPARSRKGALLDAVFARATPLEAKYLCKALGGGMRIGAQESVVVGAVARAWSTPLEQVRGAASLVTDVGELAVLARHGRLGEARLVVGKPVAFMLATPLETVATPVDPATHVVEDKIDGVRAQAHRTADGTVVLFARGLDRVTDAFPEVAGALSAATQPLVLDGEIVAVAPDGRPRPFQALQPRLKKTRPTAADLAGVRVALVAFDLLADASGPLVSLPWAERRARLEAAVSSLGATDAVRLHPARALPASEPLAASTDAAFAEARARGHEGLVLKRADAPYDAGRRGQAWIKVKRANATIDAVVVAAEEGHGKRARVLSDYTFAVWRSAPGEGEELVPVGKAYSGLTDEEIEAMTRRLDALTVERRGGLRVVRPEIVLEVAFDGLQRSSRHASGFALRFPRIARIRDDKRPEEADRIEAVEALFAAQVASGHREEEAPAGNAAGAVAGGRSPRAKKKGKAAANQLSLFEEEKKG
jgi:DNA ligase 1